MLKMEGNANPGATIEEAQTWKFSRIVEIFGLWNIIYSLLLKETTKIININLFIINISFF